MFIDVQVVLGDKAENFREEKGKKNREIMFEIFWETLRAKWGIKQLGNKELLSLRKKDFRMIEHWEKAIGLPNNRLVKVLSGEAEKKKILVSGQKRKFLGSQGRSILNISGLPWVLNEGKGIG